MYQINTLPETTMGGLEFSNLRSIEEPTAPMLISTVFKP